MVQLFREGGRKKGPAPPDDTYRMYHDLIVMTHREKTTPYVVFFDKNKQYLKYIYKKNKEK